MLERECAEAGVVIRTEVRVAKVEEGFRVMLAGGEVLGSVAVIVATGGLSIPKMGATGFGYAMAEKFGHGIVGCRPGLVPLTFGPEDRERWCDLAGVSAEVVVGSSKKVSFREKMLVTHRGMSGPAVLQFSSYWRAGETVAMDLAPGVEVFGGTAGAARAAGWGGGGSGGQGGAAGAVSGSMGLGAQAEGMGEC